MLDGVRRDRVRAIELPTESFCLSLLCRIELAGLDHRDVVVGAGDCAIAASDAHVVLKIDLAFRSALDCACRTAVHALGIVAMSAGGRYQVFPELDSGPYEAAGAVQRLA